MGKTDGEHHEGRPPSGPAAGHDAPEETKVAAAAGEGVHEALIEASLRSAFGPAFFMTHLRGFALERCPDPAAGLPVVEIHLVAGETLELCHVIGITPTWVALAVNETERAGQAGHMRTEFVPFEAIARVTLRSSRPESPHLGFEHARVPRVLEAARTPVMTPEAAIEAAAAMRPGKP